MKNKKIAILISILLAFIIMITISFYEYREYSNLTDNYIAALIAKITEQYPDIATEELIEIINNPPQVNESNILTSYGFSKNDLNVILSLEKVFYQQLIINSIFFGILIIILLLGTYLYNHKQKRELNSIINYLKELNRGNYDLQIDLNSEGALSILKNEIYTTTIMLREQADKELQDKVQLKDSLTNISHQLKTPLTSISLLVDNLCDTDIPSAIRQEFLADIKMQVENINYLIIVLLKLSRFDANVINFTKEKINVKKICFEVLKHIDVLREIKGISIHVSGASDIYFKGDYKWEFEALSNILKNCLEYTFENKNIYILFKDTNVYTEIVIQDEGPGMNKEEQKHIFERFYKGSNSSSNNFGIGLSLAKEIINKDNGTIKVNSLLGKGTTFKIRYYK